MIGCLPSFANRQIDEPHFGKTPLGYREKVARARGLHFRVRVDASCALAMPTRSFWDAVISGLSAWCPDVSSPATRAFGRARPFIALRGRFRQFPFRRDRETAADVRYGVAANERRAREDHDANWSDIVSLSRFVRTNPLSSLTRERPFPLVTRAFLTPSRENNIPYSARLSRDRAALWESVRDVNETDERGRTLLYVACRKGDARFARRALELSSGDTVNFTNVAGKHALYAAAAGGDEHVVELVVKAGAALEKKDRQGRGALWAACYHLRPNAVARLLCLGADPNARDYDGTLSLIHI